MKHEKTIRNLFAYFYDEWMDEEDRREMDCGILQAIGKTIEELDAEIEIGVKNGYTPDQQMSIIRECIVW